MALVTSDSEGSSVEAEASAVAEDDSVSKLAPKSHNLKILDGGRRHLGFLGYVKRKMSITPDWIKISASNFTE